MNLKLLESLDASNFKNISGELLDKYINKVRGRIHAGKGIKHTTAEDVLGNMQVCSQSTIQNVMYSNSDDEISFAFEVAASVLDAQPMLLHNDIHELLLTLDLPDDYIVGQNTPFNDTFITYEIPLDVKDNVEYCVGEFFNRHGDDLRIITFTSDHNFKYSYKIYTQSNFFNKPFKELNTFEKFAANFFVYTRNPAVCEVSTLRIKSKTRKQIKHKYTAPTVSFITVPSILKVGSDKERSSTGGKATCRFFVRGHYRMQRYGKNLMKQKLIWINPQVRGDEHAPLKQHVYNVK